uniref:Lysophospholipase n=1 Tax=Colletotrichum fructicola (strain Nara gc5) TaxID=1213859 RepID=L2GGG0_COLFN
MRLFTAYSRQHAAALLLRRAPAAVGKMRSFHHSQHGFFTASDKGPEGSGSNSNNGKKKAATTSLPVAVLTGGLFVWWLYPSDDFQRLSIAPTDQQSAAPRGGAPEQRKANETAWYNFALQFENLSDATDVGDRRQDCRAHLTGMVQGGPRVHPETPEREVQYSARVRVSNDLCDEEKEFLSRRKRVTTMALAKYLDIDEKDVHPEDVPTIAIGSCWLQTLYHSSISHGSLGRVLQHLKARAGIHIAYPPVAFQTLLSAPTSKYLLSGMVEKLKGDPNADFGLVDVYGLLLAARYLVPRGDLEVNDRDFKLSNQREYIKYGQNPLPIYTAVRHEIPDVEVDGAVGAPATSEAAKEVAKKEAWFQWFEITPYEFFCEEFSAGIPTWAMGRRFDNGVDVPPEEGFHLPETRMPFLLGVFGSAFCATLSHYYHEIRPLVQSLTGFGTLDEMIYGYNEDLSKVHPIDPGTVANFAYGMEGKLPKTAPKSIFGTEYIQLMDAGMSNNLPIYPLLRPGREVDVLVAFDASADIKTDNWLAAGEAPKQADDELKKAEAACSTEADRKLHDAQQHQIDHQAEHPHPTPDEDTAKGQAAKFTPGDQESGELGYCTVWPDAGIAIVYLPFLANPKVPGINPGTTDYLSTWNFVYTPEQIDNVVALARANYAEGREQIRGTVRAVYERKRKLRLEREEKAKKDRYRRLVQRGMAHKLGEGDQFS